MHHLPIFAPAAPCEGCGACCKSTPGATFPDDWRGDAGPDFERIRQALASGKWLLDWWEGDPRPGGVGEDYVDRAYFVRPAVRGFEDEIFAREATWADCEGQAGPCTFHDDIKGCTAPLKPSECAALEPREDGHCVPAPPPGYRNIRQRAAELWLPYSDALEAAGSWAINA